MPAGGAPFSGSATLPVEPLLALTGVGKRFGDFEALAEIDVAFLPGEVHCLLGENGAGKSTLCNLIFGIHRPSSGSMQLRGSNYQPTGPRDALDRRIAMVHQHFSLVGELSAIDNLLLGGRMGPLDRAAAAARVTSLAAEYGLSLKPFARVADLSVGQRQHIEIIKCLTQRPDIVILDEPTAVLLPDEIGSLLAVCREVAERGCAVVMVTHKLAEIERVADRVTVLHRGRIAARSDHPADEIDRLVRAMVQRPSGDPDSIGVGALRPRRRSRDERPVEAMQLSGISMTDQLGVRRLDDITLSIERGEIVGVAGVEGNGQSELGALLAGLTRPSDGRWFAGGRELTHASPRAITAAGVGIVPEDRHAVAAIGALSLAENLFLNRLGQFARLGLIDRQRLREAASAAMARHDVRAAAPDVPFASLSGGNQQKAVLARELATPNLTFLLAAQPTRGLDIGAVEAVYGLIREAADDGAGVLLISSELDELIAVADRIVVLFRGRIVGERRADPAHRDAIGALMSGGRA